MPTKRKAKITPRALMELRMPGEPRIAPDGDRVAYTVSETDWDDNKVAQHLHLLRLKDFEMAPRQLTRGASEESMPRWSPDGQWLAFLAAREDDEAEDDYEDDGPKAQVWLLPMDGFGGEAEKLTDAPEGVLDYDWLPDSAGLAYLAREPRPRPLQTWHEDKIDDKNDAVAERTERFRRQIWRIERDSKKAKLVTAGDFGIGEIAVSPDGTQIAYTTNRTGEDNDYHLSDVWVCALETGEARPITDGPGGKYNPVWTPDGSHVLYLRSLDPALSYSQENLYAAPVTPGPSVWLTEALEHDLTGWNGVYFDAQGRLYAAAAVGTTSAIFRRPSWDDGPWEAAQHGDEHVHDYHVAPNGGLLYAGSAAADVPELLWIAPDAEDAEPLTDLNEDWYEKYEIAPTDLVSWESPDGLTVEGLLTYPLGFDPEQRYPLLVSLHGGPHGRAVQALSPYTQAQVFAAQGYAVLAPNYRGSEGYGDAFSTASRNDLGGGDLQDVLAGVDEAIAAGVADPDRLGLFGSSYGGYLVNWAITQTPRFRAAISQFGIFSLASDFSNSQTPRWEMEYLGGAPWEAGPLYAERSPASHVQKIQTPVLILHGEGDANTFVSNSQELYTSLRLLGKTVEYVHYPREGHGLYEPEHRLDEMRRMLSWFDRHLTAADQPKTYRIGERILLNGWELTVTSASLQTYAGRAETDRRCVEVAFVLRDATERAAGFTFGPGDASLTRGLSSSGRSGRPVGLPVDVLGEKVLAEGSGWKFAFTPGKDERALTVPLALTFRVGKDGGTYALSIKDFPPVTLEVPPSDEKDEKKDAR